MKKTKEECLLMNGIMRFDLGKNNDKIMKSMDDFSNDTLKNSLPTDQETCDWYNDNIDKDCSASSAVYKFRLWLVERSKNK